MSKTSLSTLFISLAVLFAAAFGLLHSCAEGRTLWPTTREIIVRQVENGWVVEAHVKNNPYPYVEYVFTDAAVAGSAVAGLLNERLPAPRWGR